MTFGLMLGACSDAPIDPSVSNQGMPAEHPVAADLVPTEEGKSDGYGRAFDPNRLMDDDVFEDADYLSVDDIQAFLEETPYGTRSFLAEYVAQGESVSEMLHSAATEYGINPLVLITKLQVETSLVFQTVSRHVHPR